MTNLHFNYQKRQTMKKLALYLSLGGIGVYTAILLVEYTVSSFAGVL